MLKLKKLGHLEHIKLSFANSNAADGEPLRRSLLILYRNNTGIGLVHREISRTVHIIAAQTPNGQAMSDNPTISQSGCWLVCRLAGRVKYEAGNRDPEARFAEVQIARTLAT